MAQYLVERDYFSVTEIPMILRCSNDGDWHSTADLARSNWIRKIESVDHQPAPSGLSALNDFPRVEKSMRKFLRTTENYKQLVSKWKRENKTITDDYLTRCKLDEDSDLADSIVNAMIVELEKPLKDEETP